MKLPQPKSVETFWPMLSVRFFFLSRPEPPTPSSPSSHYILTLLTLPTHLCPWQRQDRRSVKEMGCVEADSSTAAYNHFLFLKAGLLVVSALQSSISMS